MRTDALVQTGNRLWRHAPAATEGAGVCATLSIQPVPLRTRVSYLEQSGQTVTAIMRHWRPGDSGRGGPCRLCPLCQAYDDGCLIVVGTYVPRHEAPLYDTNGPAFQRKGPAASATEGGGHKSDTARPAHS